MKRKCPHTVQKSSVGCFRTDPVLGLMPKKSSTEPGSTISGCCVSGLMVIGIESKRVVIK